MSTKIYTKTGDAGSTSLIGGTKVPKSHIRIETYGTVDELNSHLGLLIDFTTDATTKSEIKTIQDWLFVIGSSLAVDPAAGTKMEIPDLHESDVEALEAEIDRMNLELPEMKHFILPGGHISISQAHVCRCVCRRAERLCVAMQEDGFPVEPLIIKYLNRLSDYLFVVARYLGHLLQVPEVIWKGRG